ncbi:MAG: hypothetical protein IPL61_03380 [Myxococcales bacterium]|nr:hypothetical protein [Myxococcales bacterium]
MRDQPAVAPPARGAIHDLGYARYQGTRRAPSSNWLVIARQQIAFAWSTWWRWKLALGLAVVITAIGGGILYLVPGAGGDLTVATTMSFYRLPAFVVSMTMTSMLVARDMETGAFAFYFSRPVRPIDYVAGKLAGNFVVMACLLLAGPVLLALFRIAISSSWSATTEALPMVAVVALVGVIASLFFAVVPLAISALLGRRWLALGLWAGYYVPLTTILAIMGQVGPRSIAALDPPHALESIAFRLGEVRLPGNGDTHPSLAAAAIALGALIVVATGVFAWSVASRGTAAVGASS